MTIMGYWRIIRPVNSIVAGLAAALAYLIATGTLIPSVILLIVIVILITGAGNTINDYFDLSIDRVNRPDRPLPSGTVTTSRGPHFCRYPVHRGYPGQSFHESLLCFFCSL